VKKWDERRRWIVGSAISIFTAKNDVRKNVVAAAPTRNNPSSSSAGFRERSPAEALITAERCHLFAKSEALITRMATERRTPGPIAAFATLTAQIDAQLRNNLSGADTRALNRQRYEAIHAMADSKITGDLVANMWDRSDFDIRIAYGSFRYSAAVQASNTKIARAIIDGDADTAAQVTEAYLLLVGVSTAATLAAHGR